MSRYLLVKKLNTTSHTIINSLYKNNNVILSGQNKNIIEIFVNHDLVELECNLDSHKRNLFLLNNSTDNLNYFGLEIKEI